MNIERLFPHFITLTLLVLGAVYQNSAWGHAAVVSLALIIIREVAEKLVPVRAVKSDETDELKRLAQTMNTRIAAIEYGIKTRGF